MTGGRTGVERTMGGNGITNDRECVQVSRVGALAHVDTAPGYPRRLFAFEPAGFDLLISGAPIGVDVSVCVSIEKGEPFRLA
jgi:hypothetical protein